MDLLSRLGLACADGDRSGCRGTCEHEAGEYLGHKWPRCPVADVEADDHLQAVRALRMTAKLAPLAGFPDSYTAGALHTWQSLEGALAERREGGNG